MMTCKKEEKRELKKEILNFLYRIDLSEESVRLEMQTTSISFTEMLSNMIVKRELKKVILKNYYTGY